MNLKPKFLLPCVGGLALALAVGCPADDETMAGTVGMNDDGDEEGSEGNDDSNLESGPVSMTGQDTADSSPTPTSGPSSDSDPSDSDTDSGFISPPDGGIEGQCDPAAQDCPEGQKCTGYVSTPGGETVDANHCVEIMGDLQFGETCTRVEGNDDCAPGFFCMTTVSGHTGQGVCFEYCDAAAGAGACDNGGECFPFNDGQLPLCETICHPLAPACPAGQGCYPAFDQWVCALTGAAAGSGMDGDTCAVIQGCQPGLFCSGLANDPGGQPCTESGCCTLVCDINDPDPCTGGEMCTVLGDPPMPGYEDVGGCVLPEE